MKPLVILLTPLTWIYWAGLSLHRSLTIRLLKRDRKFPIPVISIGNLTWGGTGKTPATLWLANHLEAEGRKAVVLMRGYGADEFRLFEERNLSVAPGKNRLRSGREFLTKENCDAFILDDGFQHWPIHRDLDIVCLNAVKPFGNGQLIPCGSLREPKEALQRAQAVILTHASEVSPSELRGIEEKLLKINSNLVLAAAAHEASGIFDETSGLLDLKSLAEKPYFLVSGLGFPEGFLKTASSYLGKPPLKEFRFRDHHCFTKKELETIVQAAEKEGAFCLVSEKDWLRSEGLFKKMPQFKFLRMKLSFLKGETELLRLVRRLFKVPVLKVAILSDRKKGHLKQSLALADMLKEAALASGKVESVSTETFEIHYKNVFFKSLAWFLTPFWLRALKEKKSFEKYLSFFLLPESFRKFQGFQSDLVISAGSSLLPIHRLIKKFFPVKSIVLMKPTGFYKAKFWDLVVQPFHDGKPVGENVISTVIALGGPSSDVLEEYAQSAGKRLKLAGQKGISLFIGGNADDYRISRQHITSALEHIRSFAHKQNIPFFVTTSRRTPREVIDEVKRALQNEPCCKLLVVPTEEDVPNTMETLLGLAKVAIVTEESVSMISEAIRSRRSVVVLRAAEKALQGKKQVFLDRLAKLGWAQYGEPSDLFPILEKLWIQSVPSFIDEDDRKVKERLLALL